MGYVRREIESTNRNLLAWGIILLLLGLGFGIIPLFSKVASDVAPSIVWAVASGVLGAVFLGRFVFRILNPMNHPLLKSLSAAGDSEAISRAIDADVESGRAFSYKKLLIAGGWAIQHKIFTPKLYPLTDLMWAYQKVTTNYTNGIKTGTTYQVQLNFRNFAILNIATSSENANLGILGAVAAMAPWTVVGYSENLASLWRSDRMSWIAEVDARRLAAPAKPEPATTEGQSEAEPSRQDEASSKSIFAKPNPLIYPSKGGLIMGLAVGGFLIPFLGIAPIVLGVRELRRISAGESPKSGLVIPGMIIGVLSTVAPILAAYVLQATRTMH